MNDSRQHDCVSAREAAFASPIGAWLLFGTLWLATIGCSQRSDIAQVTGTITFEGNPVTHGTISFYPEAGGRPATGKIGSDGTYVLSTFANEDGGSLGEYKVAIDAREVVNAPPEPKSLSEEISLAREPATRSTPKIKWIVPEKYTSQANSGLTATIVEGANQIDFDLP